MDDSLLLTILQEQTKVATRTEQKVDDMNKRLFGNGQPGVIQTIYNNTKETQAELEKHSVSDLAVAAEHKKALTEVKDDLVQKISAIVSDRKSDRRWLAGAGFILAGEITAVAFYFKYIQGVFHSILK
jgi:hypothetical protein